MFIDTHAHLNFQAFEEDLEETTKRAEEDGIEKIINVGADLTSSQKAVEIAQEYENCFATVGVHPHHAENNEGAEEKLKKLAQSPKVVAIGECGLDYHPYEGGGIAGPKEQKELFQCQLNLARDLNLPVIFHCREAHNDMLAILKSYPLDPKPYPLKGVFHCFSGDQKFLKKVLEMDFLVGFDGNITYKNAHLLRELVKTTPLERLLLETDCPYLPPEPFRGLRNEPKNVKIVAGAVAEIKNLPFSIIEEQTTKNAQNLFDF